MNGRCSCSSSGSWKGITKLLTPSSIQFSSPGYTLIAMPSESSYASWHPAFMPNSAADIIAKSTQAPESSPLETLAQSLESSKSNPPAPEPSLEAHQGISKQLEVQPPKVESIEDNTTHPELTNLRNAL
jgi:hypothetical protein